MARHHIRPQTRPRLRLRSAATAMLTTSALAAALAAPAAAPTAPDPIASGSPFADCTADPGGGGETYDKNSQAEPWAAVDPADDRHQVVTWQQDRWAYGSARRGVTAVTLDGGRTWKHGVLPLTRCSGGTYGRVTNVWMTFAPGGRLYATIMA